MIIQRYESLNGYSHPPKRMASASGRFATPSPLAVDDRPAVKDRAGGIYTA